MRKKLKEVLVDLDHAVVRGDREEVARLRMLRDKLLGMKQDKEKQHENS